jgi:hypothetical protein
MHQSIKAKTSRAYSELVYNYLTISEPSTIILNLGDINQLWPPFEPGRHLKIKWS